MLSPTPTDDTSDEVNEADRKNELLKICYGASTALPLWTIGYYMNYSLKTSKNRATWPLNGIRIHADKAKLKITLIQMFKPGTQGREVCKQWGCLPKTKQTNCFPEIKKKEPKEC